MQVDWTGLHHLFSPTRRVRHCLCPLCSHCLRSPIHRLCLAFSLPSQPETPPVRCVATGCRRSDGPGSSQGTAGRSPRARGTRCRSRSVRSHPGLKLNIPAWLLCMSWWPDFEFRGTCRRRGLDDPGRVARLHGPEVPRQPVRTFGLANMDDHKLNGPNHLGFVVAVALITSDARLTGCEARTAARPPRRRRRRRRRRARPGCGRSPECVGCSTAAAARPAPTTASSLCRRTHRGGLGALTARVTSDSGRCTSLNMTWR